MAARRNSLISRTSTSIHAPSQLAVLPSSLTHPGSRTPSSRPSRHHPTYLLIILIITISCLFSSTSASPSVYIPESMIEDRAGDVQVQSFGRSAPKGRILVDQRPSPIPNPERWTLATVDELRRRAFDDLSLLSPPPAKIHLELRAALSSNSTSHSSSGSSPSSTMSSSATTRTGTKTTSSSAIATATHASVPLPSPFDQGFSGNITQSCSNFVNGFLHNATFKDCLPFSLLLLVNSPFSHLIVDLSPLYPGSLKFAMIVTC